MQHFLQQFVRFYQRYVSPRKGYQCACHTHNREISCSDHALHVLGNYPLFTALHLIWQRKHHCHTVSKQHGFTLKSMYLRHGFAVAGMVALTGCGGGGGGGGSSDTGGGGGTVTTLSGQLVLLDPTNNNIEVPISNVNYETPTVAGNASNVTIAAQTTGITGSNGSFTYQSGQTVTFRFAGKIFIVPGKTKITQQDLANAPEPCSAINDNDLENKAKCQYKVSKNLEAFFLSVDSNSTDGIYLAPQLTLDFSAPTDQFQGSLAQQLALLDLSVKPLFTPSLGINLEAPQPEADDVGGQPLPFADLFRVARPFKEYSCNQITYDIDGWPATIPAGCATENHEVLHYPSYATTIMLRYVPLGAIPTGKYIVRYNGSGVIEYYGIGIKNTEESTTGRDVIEITENSISQYNAVGIRLKIKTTNSTNPVKNIRIIMPGGICEGNPYIRIENADGCPINKFQSFESLLTDRNNIVFNPDYLRVLKDFKTLRMMNFMEASPRDDSCPNADYPDTIACLLQERTWEQRAKMTDPTWGGSSRTTALKRYGVPIEVMVALANTLNRDPWFNMPHNATDDFVAQFATYVRTYLRSNLKAHIEYTNEAWNGNFLGTLYVRKNGELQNLGSAYISHEYWAGVFFYAKRATEIFKIWEDIFNDNSRIVRILGTQYAVDATGNDGARSLSINMLSYSDTANHVDALAFAPYFWGCRHRDSTSHSICQDITKVPKTLAQATTVDDIFSIMSNINDPYGISKAQTIITSQKQIADSYHIDLYTYEGGQHLTTDTSYGTGFSNWTNLRNLFVAANRDPRMGDKYTELLNAWKNSGGKLFTLYTLPQSYHQWGNWGIKEHLNQPRSDAPKYDAIMKFQETQGKCWWNGC